MPEHPTPLDLASVLGALFAVHASPTLAAVLGAYAAIILASVAGAGWALTRSNRERSALGALAYVGLLVATSVIVTVGTTSWLHHHIPSVSTDELLAPVALIIAAIGDDWPNLARWVTGVFVRWRTGGAPKERDNVG